MVYQGKVETIAAVLAGRATTGFWARVCGRWAFLSVLKITTDTTGDGKAGRGLNSRPTTPAQALPVPTVTLAMEEKLKESAVKVETRPLAEDGQAGPSGPRGRPQQYTAAVIVNLLALGFGTVVGWPAPTQILLQSADSPLGRSLNEEEFSWLGSLVFLGGMCGTQVWGRVADRFGRKTAGYTMAVPYIIGWIVTLSSSSSVLLYVARFVLGFGGSGCFIICPLYVGEIADDAIRGTLGSYVILFMNAGVVLSYALGAALPYRWFTFVCLVVPVIFIILYWWLPETPTYLWTKNKREEAEKGLCWLRGGNLSLVREECEKFASVIKKEEEQACSVLIKNRGTRRAMIIGLGLFMVQQFCGILVILTYTVAIFEDAGSTISPNVATITLGLFQLGASYLSSLIIDRAGRKILLLISYGCMGLSLLTLGLYFWFKAQNNDVSAYGWVPVASLSIHVITYALGAGPVPYVIISETLAPKVRGLGTSTVVLWGTGLVFASVKLYPFLKNDLGFHGCFWFFGLFCVFGFLFTLFIVPETKGKPLQEILAKLNCDDVSLGEDQNLGTEKA